MADEDEWVEEEMLVVAELSGLIDSETIQKGNMKCHVLGIDTEKPVLQLDNYLFSGHYEDTLGTDLIFKAKAADISKSEADHRSIEYHCMSTKRLVMQRTFLQNKNISEGAAMEANEEEEAAEEESVSVREEEEEEKAVNTEPVTSTSSAVIFHAHTSRATPQPVKSTSANQTSESAQTSTAVDNPSAKASSVPTTESSSTESKSVVTESKSTDSASTSTETLSTVTVSAEVHT